jgi:hypothetical protein
MKTQSGMCIDKAAERMRGIHHDFREMACTTGKINAGGF